MVPEKSLENPRNPIKGDPDLKVFPATFTIVAPKANVLKCQPLYPLSQLQRLQKKAVVLTEEIPRQENLVSATKQVAYKLLGTKSGLLVFL